MADYTASNTTRNGSVNLTLTAMGTSQTVDFSDKPDERILLVVQNNNDSVAVYTASITISAGDFLANGLGDLEVDVADGGTVEVIGPLESVRFKNSASKVTVGCAVTQSGTVSSVKLGIIQLP